MYGAEPGPAQARTIRDQGRMGDAHWYYPTRTDLSRADDWQKQCLTGVHEEIDLCTK